jgi:PAS domain S-box-containing protein
MDQSGFEPPIREAPWQSLVESAPLLLGLVTPEGRIAFLNRPLGELSPAAAVGATLDDLFPSEAHRPLRTALREVWDSGNPQIVEIPYEPKEELRTRWFRVHLTLVKAGEISVGVAAAAVDITEMHQSEAELRMSVNALQRLAEEREQLASDLHDGILQSLYGVGLRLEAVRTALAADPGLPSTQHLAQAIVQLNDIMREVRSYVTRGIPTLPDEVRFDEAIAGLVRGFYVTGGPRLELKLDPAAARRLSPSAQAELLPIAREAVTNAIRHAHANRIAVRLSGHVAVIRFEVEDDGVGFAPEPSRSGFGMLNLQRRVARAGGALTIYTMPGEGTRLQIDFKTAE